MKMRMVSPDFPNENAYGVTRFPAMKMRMVSPDFPLGEHPDDQKVRSDPGKIGRRGGTLWVNMPRAC
jgi:hypothetical protein